MAELTSAEVRLARWILAEEMSGAEAEALADGAARAWLKLSSRLQHIFTVAGCEALGRRAVYLAQDDFPFLRGSAGTIGFDGFAEAFDAQDEQQARAATEAVYANLINLLVTFIGEDLALRALRDVWPGASLRDIETGQEAQT